MVKVKNNTLNIEFLLDMLSLGKNPSSICKELNISKQSINYYLRLLKANGNIIKVGYGTWEVKNKTYNTQKKQVKIRGHAFIWSLTISKDINWSNFNLKRLKNVYQIIINDRIIWLSNRKITIYENKDFNGIDAIESRRLATIEMARIIDTLKKTLNINFNYGFKVAREHYSMINNELANYYNSRKEKMSIKDDFNQEWIWIDFSDGIDELETNKLMISKKVQDWWNDNKDHNFKVTPTFILETMNGIMKNQLVFDKNMSSHLKVLGDLESAIQDLRKEVKKINIKSDNSINKTLLDF